MSAYAEERAKAEQVYDRYGFEVIDRVRVAILASIERHPTTGGFTATCHCHAVRALAALIQAETEAKTP